MHPDAEQLRQTVLVARSALAQRDALIVALAANGWTHRAIAEVAGLSHAAVGKIVRKYRRPPETK
jgi:transposase